MKKIFHSRDVLFYENVFPFRGDLDPIGNSSSKIQQTHPLCFPLMLHLISLTHRLFASDSTQTHSSSDLNTSFSYRDYNLVVSYSVTFTSTPASHSLSPYHSPSLNNVASKSHNSFAYSSATHNTPVLKKLSRTRGPPT